MTLGCFLCGLAFLVFVLLVSGVVILIIMRNRIKSPFAYVKRHEAENFFRNPTKGLLESFPSILVDAPTVDLTVVVPAYNEKKRLPKMLDECTNFLEERSRTSAFSYEVIVVDDGSRDNTSEVALSYSSLLGTDRVRVLTLVENRGKGGAVRLGVLSARGKTILFADGDAATKFSDLQHLERILLNAGDTGDIVVVGSRSHLERRAVAERSVFRTFLMKGFHWFVWTMGGIKDVKDTQCGFKLFTRSAALKCFSNLHVERWAFDIELLHIAEEFHMQIKEIAVNWQEIEGSKLIPVFSWIQMAMDIFRMRMFYIFGIWKVNMTMLSANKRK